MLSCFWLLLVIWLAGGFNNAVVIDRVLVWCFVFCSPIIFTVGLLDDAAKTFISNKLKFAAELAAAVIVVFTFDVHLGVVYLLPGYSVDFGWFGLPLSVVWLVGVANAVNIIDGIDGLAGSVVGLVLICFALLFGISGHWGGVTLCILLAGLVLGFLFHNFAPSRVFMGDTGSLFLGMAIAILSLRLLSLPSTHYPILAVLLPMALPVADVLLAMLRRALKAVVEGEKWHKSISYMTNADNEHIHHRLLYRGMNHSQACLVLCIYVATLCAVALISVVAPLWVVVVSYVYVLVSFVFFVYRLNFFDRLIILFWKSKRPAKRAVKPNSVAVVGADFVLKHSLENYHQPLFAFDFLNKGELCATRAREYELVVVNNQEGGNFADDISFAQRIAANSSSSVVLLGEQVGKEADKLVANHKNISLFVKKPVDVPLFFREIYRLLKQSANTSAGVKLGSTLMESSSPR